MGTLSLLSWCARSLVINSLNKMLKYEEEIKVWLWQLNRKALVVVVMVFVRVFFNVL